MNKYEAITATVFLSLVAITIISVIFLCNSHEKEMKILQIQASQPVNKDK